jgi:hypothetical protein
MCTNKLYEAKRDPFFLRSSKFEEFSKFEELQKTQFGLTSKNDRAQI